MGSTIDIVIPPRSVLLRPEPKGKGTDQIESLRSYLYRLAVLHSTSLHWFLKSLLHAHCFKGNTVIARNWNSHQEPIVREFSALTKRADLSLLTFSFWEDVIAEIGFRTQFQSWCPLCLRENPYERLIWTLKSLDCCPIHKVRLCQKCQFCHRVAYQSATNPSWAVCPSCKRCRCNDIAEAATATEIRTSLQLAKLATRNPLVQKPDKNRLREIWQKLILPHFSGTKAASKFFGSSSSIPYHILVSREERVHRAEISVLLRYSAAMGLDLDDMLSGDLANLKPILCKVKVSPRRQVTRAEIIQRMNHALGRSGERAHSLEEFCKEIGISEDRLRKRFPQTCRSLAIHFTEQKKRRTMLKSMTRMRRAVEFIRHHGQFVTQGKIVKAAHFRLETANRDTREARRIESLGQLELNLDV